MNLSELAKTLQGEFYDDQMMKVLYATDASVYRALPLAVAIPKTNLDLKKLILFAQENKTSLIPRAAGTSLAGQCVGEGIVVDISKYFNNIIQLNVEEQWVKVQPGVIRDELNAYLKPYGFFFSPITSTANRAMIGGMVGNNSCGTNSIVYGSTRDHVLELKTILSDSSEAVFKKLTKSEFKEKLTLDNLEGKLYQQIFHSLKKEKVRENIHTHFPKSPIHRRNTGYAIDYLANTEIFSNNNNSFNFCKLLCGSEGTLAFTTEIKLHVDPLPLPHVVVLVPHFSSIQKSLEATQIAMQHDVSACELMDKIILDCTKENSEQSKNRFFIEGDPAAVLMIEFRANTLAEAKKNAENLGEELQQKEIAYTHSVVEEEETQKVWKLRSAGLGLLSNIAGDKKATTCIEDTAVDLHDLPAYIADFTAMMENFGQESVYYAHAGAGEIHLRPMLNLKQKEDVELFYKISEASAKLVKKYKGSLSGEHGDGRLRATFLPMMVGEENYQLFKKIKSVWDRNSIFNPGKIIDAVPMNSFLRYDIDDVPKEINTLLDFSNTDGILRAAEKCNGSGDCRKLPLSGGTMCPSYHATRDEKNTTRARANILRDFLTKSNKLNPFDHEEIKEVMDLCLSCKACASECPSNVDMTALKASFLNEYQKSNGVPMRNRIFASIDRINKIGGIFPKLYNFFLTNPKLSAFSKKMIGIHTDRSLPIIYKYTLRHWYNKYFQPSSVQNKNKKNVYLFCDEITNHYDVEIGIKAVKLLDALGYQVKIMEHEESGRAAISMGLLGIAKTYATKNVETFARIISADTPLIGIEPSAILSFRDEYPKLVNSNLKSASDDLSKHCYLLDEFIAKEIKAGKITKEKFTKEKKQILLHGHCHQKSLSNIEDSIWMLSLPENYSVELIPSGCCGMAGSFGYEKEHFEISQTIGNLVLFPAVKKSSPQTTLVATGASCRHQILDGTKQKAVHSVEVLFDALNKK